LIVALVLLLVLTVLGAAGVQNTSMEERMAGNYRDRFSAFQAAEAALRAGEEAVSVYTTFMAMDFENANTTLDGYYEATKFNGSTDPTEPANYAVSVSVATINGVATVPQFFVERMPKVPLPKSSLVQGFQSKPKDIQYFRVSGRGTGSSGQAEVVLQSTYHR
jgi:type IV pilus assembly protein PilX